jgi:RNA polymerase sigma-70 factor, ECF subfamily
VEKYQTNYGYFALFHYNMFVETDLKDIQACLEGNDEAYRILVQRYEQQIVRLMWRFTRDRAECEQLVQDVFVDAYFSLKNYRGQGPFLHWLSIIATRVSYRFWKNRDRARKFISLEDFDTVAKTNTDSIDAAQAAEVLHTLLTRLHPDDRLVLTLMYFEDCSIEEIARRMSWTKAGTKMRAMRARVKLKKIAEKENFLEKFEWIE